MKKLLLIAALLLPVAGGAQVITPVDSGPTTWNTMRLLLAGSATQRTLIYGWSCASTAASTASANEQCWLKTGTGTNCGTNTAVLFSAMTPAASTFAAMFSRPVAVPAGKDICYFHAVTGTKTFNVLYSR